MTSIRWSPRSVAELEAIRRAIALDSERYAQLIVERLIAAVERLERFPQIGRVVPEVGDPGLRERIVPPFRVVYRIRGGFVEVVTIFRSARLFPIDLGSHE